MKLTDGKRTVELGLYNPKLDKAFRYDDLSSWSMFRSLTHGEPMNVCLVNDVDDYIEAVEGAKGDREELVVHEVRYEIIRNSVEFSSKEARSWNWRRVVHKGCTREADDQYPEVVGDFGTLAEAKKELEKYLSSFRLVEGYVHNLISVTEYYIEENIYDSDMEYYWCGGGDIYEFAPFDKKSIESAMWVVG